jgi:hypothetical protein
MPLTPAALRARTVEHTFTFAGEPVTVRYRPGAITARSIEALQALRAEAESDAAQADTNLRDHQYHTLAAWICEILAGWDFMEDDGVTMQPITPANLARLLRDFGDFIGTVLAEIFRDRAEGNASGTISLEPSGATSSRTGNSTNSPTRSSRKQSA